MFANVTPSRDVSGEIIGFHSARRNPSKAALEVIKPLYAQLLEAERSGGLTQSEALLERILQDKGVSYEEFIFSI